MKLLGLIICDILILTGVSLLPALLRRFGSPPTRGFYCDDETIRYPFVESTISIPVLYEVGVGASVTIIVLTEIVQARNRGHQGFHLLRINIPLWAVNSYKFIGVFSFGAASVQVISQVCSFSVGRLRPNFIDVCDPNVNCSSPDLQFQYITNYTCLGSPEKVNDSRLSFPSGHACFSSFAAFYMALYIQRRWNIMATRLLKPAVQLGCIVLCWVTSLSRIHDHQHHWSDVAVGLIIGITTAGFAGIFVSNMIESPRKEKIDPLKDSKIILE